MVVNHTCSLVLLAWDRLDLERKKSNSEAALGFIPAVHGINQRPRCLRLLTRLRILWASSNQASMPYFVKAKLSDSGNNWEFCRREQAEGWEEGWSTGEYFCCYQICDAIFILEDKTSTIHSKWISWVRFKTSPIRDFWKTLELKTMNLQSPYLLIHIFHTYILRCT